MICKPSLEELSMSIDALYGQFLDKVSTPFMHTTLRERRADDQITDPNRYIFLRGEVLILGNMTQDQISEVIRLMRLNYTQLELTYLGDPLYFTDSASTDTEAVPNYYLKQTDLPYGFAGPQGTFQFSSPEISQLRRSPNPQILANSYAYFGTDWKTVDYEQLDDPSRQEEFFPMMNGLGWVTGSSTPELLKYLDQGLYNNITLRDPLNQLITYDFTRKDDLIKAINESPFYDTWPDSLMYKGLNDNNYDPGAYLGWRWINQANMNVNSPSLSIERPILQMPAGQESTFNVNSSTQQPYRGAEGVYPVVLLEFLTDVFIEV